MLLWHRPKFMNPSHSVRAALGARRCAWTVLLALVCPGAAWAAPSTPADAQPAAEQRAELPPNRFDLHYVAPTECPSMQEFVAWTNQFYVGADATTPSTRDWQASPGELAGSARVKVVGDGTRYTAHLVMVDADGKCPTSRPPHTETTCADAVRAMAYSLAQALKAPPCSTEALTNGQPAACPPAPAPAPAACPLGKPCPPHEKGIRGEVGLAAGVVTPLAEDIAWGGALLVGFTRPRGGPSARFSAGYWDAGRVPIGHQLQAQLWSVGLSLCPFAIGLTSWLSLPLCGTAEVGQVALSGLDSAAASAAANEDAATPIDTNDRANLYLWGTLGVATRLRFEHRWLFAEVEPNLVFPLLHHPVYVHQPSSDMSEQQDSGQVGGWVALKVHLNVGVAFP